MQRAASILLTLLIFLVGGNFAAACNRESSAPLGDLCALAVQKVFLTTDNTDYTDKREATDKGRCSEGEFRNLFLSVPICEIRGQKISSSANQNGHRTQNRELSSRTINNTFDALHRLTAEKIERGTGVPPVSSNSALGTLSSSYDLVGNRQSRTTTGSTALTSLLPNQTQSFTSNDRLTTDTYDANGNTTQSVPAVPAGSSSNVTDVYSFDNKLIRRTTPDGKTINLTYNPDGLRLAKLIAQGGLTQRLHHYLTDANNPTGYAQVIEEKDPLAPTAEQLKKVHLYGHDLISSSVYQPSTLNHQLLFYSYDGLGSVRSISDTSGELLETYDYDVYGTLIGLAKRNAASGDLESSNLNSPDSALRTPASEFLFAGEQYDLDLGMYFLRARYLNTNTGRFHSQDTYEGLNGEPLTLHKYIYANGNPASYTDPSGNMGLAIEMQSVSYSLVSLGGQTFDYGRVRGQAVAIAKPLALVFGTAAIAGTGIYLYLKTSEDALKETRDRIKDEIDKKRRGASVVFHYTDKVSAIGILATGFMATSPPFRGSFVTYPQGAYASTIPPYSSSITQSQLSAHFYGGNVSKDVSMAVIIDSYGFLPVFGGPPDFRYKPGPLGGLTDVRVYGVIPNLMDPK